MIKVSTMLYVRPSENTASVENTREFLEKYEVRDVITKMMENDQLQMEFGAFLVDLLVYEVEEQFIKFLFANHAAPGLIYCGTIDHPDTMWVDLTSLLPNTAQITFEDMLTGVDITEDVIANKDNYNVMQLICDDAQYHYYTAFVMKVEDEEEDDEDDIYIVDANTHVC